VRRHIGLQRRIGVLSLPVVSLVGRRLYAENHLLPIFAAKTQVSTQTVGIEKVLVTLNAAVAIPCEQTPLWKYGITQIR